MTQATACLRAPGVCAGITPGISESSYTTGEVDGHGMVMIPGGFTVVGSRRYEDAAPTWIRLSPYAIDTRVVSEGQFQNVLERAGNEESPPEHPVTMVTHHEAREYVETIWQKCSERFLEQQMGKIYLPTEAQWENAAQGPAVDMRRAMEADVGRFLSRDFVDWSAGRYRNFVQGIMGKIFSNPEDGEFQRLLQSTEVFYGWPNHATPSGGLVSAEAWFNLLTPAPVTSEVVNGYGLHHMTGNVWEWMKDWYTEHLHGMGGINPQGPEIGEYRSLRGGPWNKFDREKMHLSYRYNHKPNYRSENIGFRIATLQEG